MSDTQATIQEFRFLDDKRRTSGLSSAEEQRWYELGAAVSQSGGQNPGMDGDPNAQWYAYGATYEVATWATYYNQQGYEPAAAYFIAQCQVHALSLGYDANSAAAYAFQQYAYAGMAQQQAAQGYGWTPEQQQAAWATIPQQEQELEPHQEFEPPAIAPVVLAAAVEVAVASVPEPEPLPDLPEVPNTFGVAADAVMEVGDDEFEEIAATAPMHPSAALANAPAPLSAVGLVAEGPLLGGHEPSDVSADLEIEDAEAMIDGEGLTTVAAAALENVEVSSEPQEIEIDIGVVESASASSSPSGLVAMPPPPSGPTEHAPTLFLAAEPVAPAVSVPRALVDELYHSLQAEAADQSRTEEASPGETPFPADKRPGAAETAPLPSWTEAAARATEEAISVELSILEVDDVEEESAAPPVAEEALSASNADESIDVVISEEISISVDGVDDDGPSAQEAAPAGDQSSMPVVEATPLAAQMSAPVADAAPLAAHSSTLAESPRVESSAEAVVATSSEDVQLETSVPSAQDLEARPVSTQPPMQSGPVPVSPTTELARSEERLWADDGAEALAPPVSDQPIDGPAPALIDEAEPPMRSSPSSVFELAEASVAPFKSSSSSVFDTAEQPPLESTQSSSQVFNIPVVEPVEGAIVTSTEAASKTTDAAITELSRRVTQDDIPIFDDAGSELTKDAPRADLARTVEMNVEDLKAGVRAPSENPQGPAQPDVDSAGSTGFGLLYSHPPAPAASKQPEPVPSSTQAFLGDADEFGDTPSRHQRTDIFFAMAGSATPVSRTELSVGHDLASAPTPLELPAQHLETAWVPPTNPRTEQIAAQDILGEEAPDDFTEKVPRVASHRELPVEVVQADDVFEADIPLESSPPEVGTKEFVEATQPIQLSAAPLQGLTASASAEIQATSTRQPPPVATDSANEVDAEIEVASGVPASGQEPALRGSQGTGIVDGRSQPDGSLHDGRRLVRRAGGLRRHESGTSQERIVRVEP
jgi:hypothetical protein